MRKFLIKVNGIQYDVEVEEVGGVKPIVATGPVVAAPVQAPVSAVKSVPSVKSTSPTPAGANKITSPMPGTILKVNVNSGEAVKQGQVLLILEAMKMENEITAPKDGTVASVNVEKGQSVGAGEILISLS